VAKVRHGRGVKTDFAAETEARASSPLADCRADGGAAQAQNIDQGKSATRLFADSCATCHHNPRVLPKAASG